jgi:hypothetical protein
VDLNLPAHAEDKAHGAMASLFAEELGLVLEVEAGKVRTAREECGGGVAEGMRL